MIVKIDFNSEEAIYIQLRNQIIMGIATSQIGLGESLPSVRQMAQYIGVNMHTVNKAYSVLKQDGYIKLDRRRGAVVDISDDKKIAYEQLFADMKMVLAEAMCKNISADEIHAMVDEIYGRYACKGGEKDAL
ncbi:MAG: GntR family transcriptional regulator [Lachnospiraceae bacterium]|nr:GntR family transcriptional regulator [Lachnospiraceae bacterium]